MVGMVPSIFVLIATWLIPASAVGGLGATEAATQETDNLITPLKLLAWQKAREAGFDREFSSFKAVSARSQLVAGRNHFVKVSVGSTTYIHLRIFEPQPHSGRAPQLVALELNHTLESEIEYFPRPKREEL